jgi:AAA domain/TrwC relaxase
MSYYTASGKPPGEWAGKGAAALGLTGSVDPAVIGRLYQRNIGPGGELLVKRRQSRAADEREEAAVAAYQAAHPHASATEAVWSMAQLRFEVHRALPVLPPGADAEAVLTEVTKLALCSEAGTEVIQITAPDITDVTSLGVRASDGGSIYRPPNQERYCTLAHLDTEQQVLTAAKRAVPQLVTAEQARAAAERTGLTAGQRDAVITMLTATTAMTVLVAAAGAGKSHTMAGFARLWTTFTGRRVIGLATATNAARVLASEGLGESYNIAQFLGKIDGSDELRRPVPLYQDDVLVVDEASQLGTADLALVQEAARAAGARLVLVGDTEQLGAVDAGGIFRLLAREVPAAELHEVRRFDAAWEADASVRLRAGDFTAYAAYDRHGRMRGADQETAYDRATGLWLADHLRGKNVLLLAGSNGEAAELSRRVQAKLIQLGTVQRPQAALSDGNQAGTGDLIRARLNTTINAVGRKLTNRDTLKITGWKGPSAQVRRRELDGTWTSPFLVPRDYLAGSAELDYAGNTHVGQGRTVDTAHLLVTGTLSRRSLYVGLTRGRESNTAHIVTGNTAPPGHPPYAQVSPESVVKAIMDRDDADLSATEQIRHAQDQAGGTGHLLTLWSAAVRHSLYPRIDEQIKARLTGSQAWRYEREHARPVLQQRLRAAQLAGRDIAAVIDQITAVPMDGARSISAVLHGRLQQLQLPDLGHDVTCAQRTPKDAPAVAHELAAGLDQRARTLGEQLAASPEPWLARRLGVLAPHASPLLREDYASRAAAAAVYREAAGITDPDQAIVPEPHRGNPELDLLRQAAIRALEIRDETEILSRMTNGELEARILDGDRTLASAAPDVSRDLRLTAQAEVDAWQQSADAEIRHDPAGAASARTLARQIAARREQLEAVNASYEKWAADTNTKRETAGKARTELERRGLARHAGEERQAQPDGEPQTMAGWWRQLEADLAAVDHRLEQEHQAALAAGTPWPPERKPQPEPAPEPEPEPAAGPRAATEPGNWSEPPVASPEAASDFEPDGRAARLDELLARVSEAAQRVAAENAEGTARAEYAVRVEREAQAEPELALQAESPSEAEIEL